MVVHAYNPRFWEGGRGRKIDSARLFSECKTSLSYMRLFPPPPKNKATRKCIFTHNGREDTRHIVLGTPCRPLTVACHCSLQRL